MFHFQSKKDRDKELLRCGDMLKDRLFKQTAAMFVHCCDSGIPVPEELYQKFISLLQESSNCRKVETGSEVQNEPDTPQQITTVGWDENIKEVVKIHNTLAAKVAPATPKAILLIESEMMPVNFWRNLLGFRFLGPIKIVRFMMAVSLIALIIFLGVSLSKHVNFKNLASGLLVLDGWPLFFNMLFLLAASGLGASFALLFELRTYIANRTYDPVYATDYWIRFFLGLISGFVLAVLIPVQNIIDSDSFITELSIPLLAMLGGFSVQAVYRILQRFVVTLETMIQGSPSQNETARQTEVKEESKKQILKHRTTLLSELAKIQKSIQKGEATEKIKEVVEGVFDKVSSFDEIR